MIPLRKQRGFWNFVVPAIAGLAGAALSSKSNKDASERAAQATADANAANYAAQKEFAQHGIQWKVEDAKAAGLHPLFGAGLGGTTFSPAFNVAPTRPAEDFSWITQLGQLLGGYIGNQQRKELAGYSPDAKMYDHPTMDELQGIVVNPIRGLESQIEGRPLGWEGVPMAYNERLALNKRHITEESYYNPKSAMELYNWGPGGFQMLIPKTSEPQELFDDKPAWFWAHVVQQNVEQFGPGWLSQARKQFPSDSQFGNLLAYLGRSGLEQAFSGELLLDRLNRWAHEQGAATRQRILKFGEQFRR